MSYRPGLNLLEIGLGKVPGYKIISKFGKNYDVDGEEDIWGGDSSYPGFPTGSAENFEVFSSSVNDTNSGTGANTIRLYYLDDNYNAFDANENWLYTDVTMNGTTGVNTGVSGVRIWRAKVLTSGSGQTNAGDITIRHITTTANIFQIINAGTASTHFAGFTIPNGWTGYLLRFNASMTDIGDQRVQMVIRAREFNSNTFRESNDFVVATNNDITHELCGGLSFSSKTDFIFRAKSTTSANAVVTVTYGMLFVKN